MGLGGMDVFMWNKPEPPPGMVIIDGRRLADGVLLLLLLLLALLLLPLPNALTALDDVDGMPCICIVDVGFVVALYSGHDVFVLMWPTCPHRPHRRFVSVLLSSFLTPPSIGFPSAIALAFFLCSRRSLFFRLARISS